jgi:proteasome lid subunit RPN8/RPN11
MMVRMKDKGIREREKGNNAEVGVSARRPFACGAWSFFRLLGSLRRSFAGDRRSPAVGPELPTACSYQRLRRVVLTDEVGRTLFHEYAGHRASARGEEEIGWVLLGIRDVDEALVLATLPAGSHRSAGVAHVKFNSSAQALGSRIVRQWDKRLSMLGVVHTHPGSLRHPSDGDYQGDSLWVGRLRGGEGIFGIGTADGPGSNGVLVGNQPQRHVQAFGKLLLSWYALGEGDRQYRPIDVQLTLGPDLALRLHDLWTTIETFAEPLERLCRQQAGVSFDVGPGQRGSSLAVSLKLAEPKTALRIVLENTEAALYWEHGQELMAIDMPADQLDRSVYLALAELAGRDVDSPLSKGERGE